ncbi:MAG: hypothetical protein PUF12_04405 [Thermoflexaceae bacterium]|nr:hypothetical protein [Thermoflexaceae bacterium]
MKFLKKINPMLVDLISGCAVYGIVGEIIILTVVTAFYHGSIGKIALGFLIGVVLMMIMAVHMYFGVDASLSMGEGGAQKHQLKMFAIRIVAVLVVFVVVLVTGFCDAISVIIGMMSLKVSAYLQPFTHKFLVSKIIK